MEELIKLVAASLARHGVECPAEDPRLVWGRATSPTSLDPNRRAQSEPTALPEHNFRKNLQGDPAP
jgi:hypothetical protein